MRATHVIIILALVLLANVPAQAQIHFTGPTNVSLVDFSADGSSYGINQDISNATASPTANGFSLKGDVTLYLDRTLPPQPSGSQPVFDLFATQSFTVGPLPVSTHTALQENLEAVIGLGTHTAPSMKFSTEAQIYVEVPEVGGTLAISLGDLDIHGIGNSGLPLVGNSFGVFDSDKSSGDYILAPGFNYYMAYILGASVDNNGLDENSNPPTAALTFEFGGVSRFNGIDDSVVGVLLPEPSSIVLAASGLLIVVGAAVRRRFRSTGSARIGCGKRLANAPLSFTAIPS